VTLDQFRPVATRLLRPFVAGAEALGLSPNTVSLVAFGFAFVAAGAFAAAGSVAVAVPTLYVVGGVATLLNGSLDLLDGQLAREQGVDSRAGDFLDHVLDRYADVVIVAGLAAGTGRYDLGLAAVTGVLLTSYMGTQIQAVGLGRAYGGLVGRADRLVLIGVVGLLVPIAPGRVGGLTLVGWLLVFFAVVGHLTALQRFWLAWSDLR
jgi:archaetidylinositol phosphate synthase